MALKIMVVDDEQDVLKVIKGLVEPLGVEVLAIADSREAAQRANNEKFDGVFLDTRMPHLDGFSLAKSVRGSRLNNTVPIVMITGASDAETMRKGFQAGVTFFLSKPINLERMAGLLRAMRWTLLREKRRYSRLPLRAPVICQFGEKRFRSESANISEGGMLLETSGGAKLEQELGLEFVIPQSSHKFQIRAKVVRKEPPDRIAVQFLYLSPEDRSAIQDYIIGKVRD